jgi:hypothetical protein
MKRLDKKLPDLWHGFQGLAAQRIHIYRNPPPPRHAQPLGISGSFDCRTSFPSRCSRQKRHAGGKNFGQINPFFLSAGTEEALRKRGKHPRAIAAGAIRIHSAAVRQPF